MLKRFLSCVAALCLAASLVPATALATVSDPAFENDARALFASETGTCTVTFDPGEDGEIAGSSTKTETVSNGDLIDAPANPTRSGMRFAGWYANQYCEGMPWYNVLNSYRGETVTGNMTLYAKWIDDTFDRERDGLNFANTEWDFFDSGNFSGHKDYRLSGDYYELLKQQQSGSRWSDLTDMMNETWGGSCFGMCAMVALLYAGKIMPDFLQAGATCAHDLEKPALSSVVKNTVNYYFLQQVVGKLAEARQSTRNETTNIERLLSILQPGSGPAILGFDIMDVRVSPDEVLGGHAVLAFYKGQVGNDHEFEIWDPNYPNGNPVKSLTVTEHTDNGVKTYTSKFDAVYDDSSRGYASFIKYAVPVESGYDEGINAQKIISAMAGLNSFSAISRAVQFAMENSDEPVFEMTLYDRDSISITGKGEDGAVAFSVDVHDGKCTSCMNCDPEIVVVNEFTSDQKKLQISIPCTEMRDASSIEIAKYWEDGDSDLPTMTCKILNSADSNRYLHVYSASRVVLENWIPDAGFTQLASVELDGPITPDSSNCLDDADFCVGVENDAGIDADVDRIHIKGAYTKRIPSDTSETGFAAEKVPGTFRATQSASDGFLLDVMAKPLEGHEDILADDDLIVDRHMVFYFSEENDISKHKVAPVEYIIVNDDGIENDGPVAVDLALKMISDSDFGITPLLANVAASSRAVPSAKASASDALGIIDKTSGEMLFSTSVDKTVLFFSMGGTPLDERTGIGSGNIIGRMKAPVREGFLFDGWFTDAGCTSGSAWDGTSDAIDADTVLYAQWQRDPSFAHRVTLKDGDDEVVYLVRDGADLAEVPRSSAESGLWSKSFESIKQDIVAIPSETGPEASSTSTYSVRTTNTTGSVDCSPSGGVSAGTKVRVTASADGQRVDKIVAKRADDESEIWVSASQSDGTYAFIMPESDVNVQVTFVPVDSGITRSPIQVSDVNNGTLTVTSAAGEIIQSAARGEKVTITATPSSKCKLNSLSVSSNGAQMRLYHTSADTYMFFMPATAASIAATFLTTEQTKKYDIAVPLGSSITHGSFEVTPSSAREGETVKVAFKPDNGYLLDAGTISVLNETSNEPLGYSLSQDGTFLTFEMPASNVSIYGTFKEKTYALTIGSVSPAGSGTLIVYEESEDTSLTSPMSVAAGRSLRIVPQAATGYKLSALSYKPAGAAEVPIVVDENGTYRFTMPPADTVIVARFDIEIDPSKPHLQFTGKDDDEPAGEMTMVIGGEALQMGYRIVTPETTEASAAEQKQLSEANDALLLTVRDPGADSIVYETVRTFGTEPEEEEQEQENEENEDEEEEDGEKEEGGEDSEEDQVTIEVVSDDLDIAKASIIERVGDKDLIAIEAIKTGTVRVTARVTNDEAVQPAVLVLTILPFVVNVDTASTSILCDADPAGVEKTSMSLMTANDVKAFKDSGAIYLRMNSIEGDDATAAETIINGMKNDGEALVHLVDLALVDSDKKVVETLSGVRRRVTFKMTEDMKAHRKADHELFVACVLADKSLEVIEDIEYDRLVDPTTLSFMTNHFSTYAVMAKGVTVEYAITIQKTEGGSIEASRSTAAAGTPIVITAEPDNGYEAKEPSVVQSDDTEVSLTASATNSWTFTMPASDVRVTAKFEKTSVVESPTPTPTPTPAPTPTPTPKPIETSPDPNPDDDDDRTGTPVYDVDTDDGDDSGAKSSNADQSDSRKTVANSRTTASTAGNTAVGGGQSTSLVKTNDELFASTICSIGMGAIIVAALIYLRRFHRR